MTTYPRSLISFRPAPAAPVQKFVKLALNNFPRTPSSLRKLPGLDEPKTEIEIDLANLFHHYYEDKHGKQPPSPDPAQFEHLQYLTPDRDFRVRGDGLGPTSASRRTHSNELGHAFCRMFLHDHLNITYIAHIEHVLRRGALSGYGNISIERKGSGDTPDYFCAKNANTIYLSEAKGRHSAISFKNAEFAKWRKQFDTILVKDASGNTVSMKGYIVGTRFATEAKPNTDSTLYAEDPATPGERPFGPDDAPQLGQAVISLHYAEIAAKLNQRILADALARGYVVPREILFPSTVWTLQFGPLTGTRFVGGYYPSTDGPLTVREVEGRIIFGGIDPFRLDVNSGTFFGLEEKIFKQVTGIARAGPAAAQQVSQFEQVQPFYSGVSILRDGSVIGPVEFFSPTATVSF